MGKSCKTKHSYRSTGCELRLDQVLSGSVAQAPTYPFDLSPSWFDISVSVEPKTANESTKI